MNLHIFSAIFKARTMEFVRDKGTLFWNILFPFILVFGISIAFSGSDSSLFSAGYSGEPSAGEQQIFDLPQFSFIDYTDALADGSMQEEEILNKVRLHTLDMYIDFSNSAYYINDQAEQADLLRYVIETAVSSPVDSVNESAELTASSAETHILEERIVSGEAVRYVDWLVPGVIGMNMLFSCLFGVGIVIVRYRKNGVLKRLKATPVRPIEFISAQMASRFVIVLATSIFVFTAIHIVLRFQMLGSYLSLLVITSAALFCMISLGLLFSSRIRSEELAGGLMNLVTFPMVVFSGVFFSLEGSSETLQKAASLLPLSLFVDGARAVMLEGASFLTVLPNIAALTGMAVLFLSAASVLFAWE